MEPRPVFGVYRRLHEIIGRFSEARLLCIGDIMLDRFVRGTVERISPEAPVPVMRYVDEAMMLGGAGNVVANLRALTCPTFFVGMTGQDAEGLQLAELLTQCGAEHHLNLSERWTTSLKVRFVSENHHLLRFDRERPGELSQGEEEMLLDQVRDLCEKVDAILLSDYAKGLLSPRLIQGIISAAKKYEKPVMIDPKGSDYQRYRGAFLVTPNRKELELVMQERLDPRAPDFIKTVARAAGRLAGEADIEHVIVTLGGHGMLHVGRESQGEYTHLPTMAKEVFDVSGAGDTSFAALGASCALGATVLDAMHIANAAAGIVVGKFGTATTDPAAIDSYLASQFHGQGRTDSKLVSLEEAVVRVQHARDRGKVIGFTNGCFDLLHRGHLYSLEQARKACDFLVVGLNTDASVKKLKGPSRPFQDECTRGEVMAALACVDLVLLFDEPTAESVVEALRPDLIAKEGYDLKAWPEAQLVEAYGGKVLFLDRLEGCSTSDLAERFGGK